MKHAKLVNRFRIGKVRHFHLAGHDCADTCGLDIDKDAAKAMLAGDIAQLAQLQESLYAQNRRALLVIFQAMDAAGKDSAIKHVMSGINPQGCEVHSFGAPSAQELDHDFMWRTSQRLPERGRIGIFNRSYYEEVLAVRVRPELLDAQRLPHDLVGKNIWRHRCKDIRAFERYLTRNGTVVVKFFLNVSKAEQRRRFLERLDDPNKRWKFSMGDIDDRKLWNRYMAAYADMIRHTATGEAPWHVVPADNKWFTRLVVAATLVETLQRLDLSHPKVSAATLREMAKVRRALVAERPARSAKSG